MHGLSHNGRNGRLDKTHTITSPFDKRQDSHNQTSLCFEIYKPSKRYLHTPTHRGTTERCVSSCSSRTCRGELAGPGTQTTPRRALWNWAVDDTPAPSQTQELSSPLRCGMGNVTTHSQSRGGSEEIRNPSSLRAPCL